MTDYPVIHSLFCRIIGNVSNKLFHPVRFETLTYAAMNKALEPLGNIHPIVGRDMPPSKIGALWMLQAVNPAIHIPFRLFGLRRIPGLQVARVSTSKRGLGANIVSQTNLYDHIFVSISIFYHYNSSTVQSEVKIVYHFLGKLTLESFIALLNKGAI